MGDEQRELFRLNQLFIPADVIEDILSCTVKCSNCSKILGEKIYLCEGESNFCDECFPAPEQKNKWVCPETGHNDRCKVFKNFNNFTLLNLKNFALTQLRIPIETTGQYSDAFLNGALLNELHSLVQCHCGINMFAARQIFLCKRGHTLCQNCMICRCGKAKLVDLNSKIAINNSPVQNFCNIINSQKPPEVVVKCLIRQCQEYIPLQLMLRHITELHSNQMYSVSECTETSTKKRSRLYQTIKTYQVGEPSIVALTSEQGDIIFFESSVNLDLGLQCALKSLRLEAENKVKCCVRIKKESSSPDVFVNCTKYFEVTVDRTDASIPNKCIITSDDILQNGSRETLPFLVIEIILGSDKDIDMKTMKALGGAWTPLEYQ